MVPQSLAEKGWCRFPFDPALAAWVAHALPAARRAVAAPENAQWLRCGGTWFAGVNALDTLPDGAVSNGPPLAGRAVGSVTDMLGGTPFDWGPGQVSVCYPGYPKPMDGESDAAFRYRQNRDAAHVDGLLPEGPARRRHLRERHAFLLGIPMVESGAGASPFVVWEGSHRIMRDAFAALFGGLPSEAWGDVDATEAYHAARRTAFEACPRVEIAAKPGEAYLVHRHALHGVAPWADGAEAGPDGRMIVYFRPEIGPEIAPETGSGFDWLNAA